MGVVTCAERFVDERGRWHRCTREPHPETELHRTADAVEHLIPDSKIKSEIGALMAAGGGLRAVAQAAQRIAMEENMRDHVRYLVEHGAGAAGLRSLGIGFSTVGALLWVSSTRIPNSVLVRRFERGGITAVDVDELVARVRALGLA